jgi:hypothetical protein
MDGAGRAAFAARARALLEELAPTAAEETLV